MARKKGKDPEASVPAAEPAPKVPIEDLFDKHGVPQWQRRGLMRAKRWAAGKRVSDGVFLRELNAWLRGPAGR